MTLLQPAKFFAGAGGHTEPTAFSDKYGSPHASHPVIVPAVLQIDGHNFSSEVPKSATHAARINAAIEQLAAVVR
jgi:hypothetical protein